MPYGRLSIEELGFGYPGRVRIIQSLSLRLQPSLPLVLTGPNGCGKSTLLRLLAGELTPDAGRVRKERNSGIVDCDADKLRRLTAIVKQDPEAGLFAELSLRENLALLLPGASLLDPYVPSCSLLDFEEKLGELLPFYEDRKHTPAYSLSGGQVQRLALGIARLQEPALVLLDEPFSAVDDATASVLEDATVSWLRNGNLCSLIVTHDLQFAERWSLATMDMRAINAASRDTPGATPGVLQVLDEDHTKYFVVGVGARELPLPILRPTRCRFDGIVNANLLMRKAALGELEKREPISVRPSSDGTFVIDDGNSTYANAVASGWSSLPCQIQSAEASPAKPPGA